MFYEQVNFGKGMLGKSLQDRTDMEIYQQAVFNAVNYIVTGQGTLKAQGLDLSFIELDPGLLLDLNNSDSHLVLHEGTSTKYTVFVKIKGNTIAKAYTFEGLPSNPNLKEVYQLPFGVTSFLFGLGKEVFFKDAEGVFKKFEWFFSLGSVKYEMLEVFTFPPVRLESTRLTNVPDIATKLDVQGLKYKYDPRTKFIEIAFTNPAQSTMNITKMRFSTRGWGFKNGKEWVTKVDCFSYQGTKIAGITDRLHAGGSTREVEVNNALSLQKVIIGRDIDTDSGGRAYINVEYFNSVTGTWHVIISDQNIQGGGDITRDGLGVNPPSAEKPNPDDLIPFFRENMYEIDIAGNRARFDSLTTISPSTSIENDPFPGNVKIIAKYELTTNQGVDTLEYDYKNSKEQVMWIGTDPKFCFARKEFKEVNYAEIFEFYQDRLIIAGIPNYEDTIIMSAINDFKDFSIRNMPSDPIITKFTSPRGKVKITGFGELASLLVYTNFGVWCTPAKQMFTAGQSKFEFISSIQLEPKVQQSLSENIVIVGKNRDRLYQINYNDESRKYVIKDLNIVNNDIIRGARSIIPLNLGGQSEFTFIAIFANNGVSVLNLDDKENILGYTKMSLTPRTDYNGVIRILGEDYGWYGAGLAKVVPVAPERSWITFLIPVLQTEKGLMKFDDYSKIKGVTIKVIGDYACGFEYDEDVIEPPLQTDETELSGVTPVIDYENSRPLYFRALDNIPVNRKLTFYNEKVNDNNHEITSVLFDVN